MSILNMENHAPVQNDFGKNVQKSSWVSYTLIRKEIKRPLVIKMSPQVLPCVFLGPANPMVEIAMTEASRGLSALEAPAAESKICLSHDLSCQNHKKVGAYGLEASQNSSKSKESGESGCKHPKTHLNPGRVGAYGVFRSIQKLFINPNEFPVVELRGPPRLVAPCKEKCSEKYIRQAVGKWRSGSKAIGF